MLSLLFCYQLAGNTTWEDLRAPCCDVMLLFQAFPDFQMLCWIGTIAYALNCVLRDFHLLYQRISAKLLQRVSCDERVSCLGKAAKWGKVGGVEGLCC